MGRHRGGKLWGGPLVRGQKRDIKTFPSRADVTKKQKYVKNLGCLVVRLLGSLVVWWFGVLLCR